MDVAAWLDGLGLSQYEQAFRDNEIDERARRAVNLPLSVLKPGCGSRALCGSKLRSGVKNARPKSRNRKFESISLQGRVSCELDAPKALRASVIAHTV
jgi:hypothetical protein